MTKLEKIETAKNMKNEELLEYLIRYTKQNFFEMEESKRETYSIIKEEVLKKNVIIVLTWCNKDVIINTVKEVNN